MLQASLVSRCSFVTVLGLRSASLSQALHCFCGAPCPQSHSHVGCRNCTGSCARCNKSMIVSAVELNVKLVNSSYQSLRLTFRVHETFVSDCRLAKVERWPVAAAKARFYDEPLYHDTVSSTPLRPADLVSASLQLWSFTSAVQEPYPALY